MARARYRCSIETCGKTFYSPIEMALDEIRCDACTAVFLEFPAWAFDFVKSWRRARAVQHGRRIRAHARPARA